MTSIAALERRIVELELALSDAHAHVARLETLAYEDPLTGALNRRGFERELRRAVSFQKRYGTPVALVVLDLDDFKAINDRYGHAAGDAVLLTTARVLKDSIRASDSLARIGGDEFAILLWHIDLDSAEMKGNQLLRRLKDATATVDGGIIEIRASFGVSLLDESGDIAATYARADRSLYAEKAQRRSTAA